MRRPNQTGYVWESGYYATTYNSWLHTSADPVAVHVFELKNNEGSGDVDVYVYKPGSWGCSLLCQSIRGGTATDTCRVKHEGEIYPVVLLYDGGARGVHYTLTQTHEYPDVALGLPVTLGDLSNLVHL